MIIAYVLSFILCLILTPWVKKLSYRMNIVAVPNTRSVHSKTISRFGGFAIFTSFFLAYWIMSWFTDFELSSFYGILAGAIIIEIVGIVDDKWELSSKVKLTGQVLAAGVVMACGIQIPYLTVPFTDISLTLGWVSYPLTLFWIVGITNAINLIDGLDGLAAGVASIAVGTMMVMAIITGNTPLVIVCAILLGTTTSFLIFNFYPAKLFMGDSGSLFLGFMFATLSIYGYKQIMFVSLIIPALLVAVPLSDTLFAMLRRKLNQKSMFSADKEHLHHRLIDQHGFSHAKTVLVIYAISTFFGLCAILLSQKIVWVAAVLIPIILIIIGLFAEIVGVFSSTRKPLHTLFLKMHGLFLRK
jgi:UDP-GlcNAc:undecaprenyl-phosphate GlcNAc-1-phosphate transferase